MKQLLLSLSFLFVSISSFAGDYTWTNGGGDKFWNNPANWDLGFVPGPGDTATIGTGGDVILDIATSIHELTLSSASLHLNGLQLQVDSAITISNSVLDDGTFAAGVLYGDSLGDYSIANTVSDAEFLIYSIDWANCEGNTYNGEVYYAHIGSTNENIRGNNIYNNKVSYETLNGRFRPESNANSTFNADTIHFYNNSSINENIYFSQAARATLNSVILSVNGFSNGSIRIGSNGGNTGAIKLNGTSNLHNNNLIDGTFYIYHLEQQNPNPINLSFLDTVSCQLFYDSIQGPLTIVGRNILMRENYFFNTVNVRKIGNGNSSSAGGNHFQGITTLENAGSGEMRYGTNAALPDTFATDVILINSGTSIIQMSRNASNTHYGGDIYLNATSGNGIRFGQSGGTTTIPAGNQLIVGGLGYSSGSLRLRGITQVGATAQNLTLTGSADIRLEQNSTWNGPITVNSPRIYLTGSTYNNTLNITKTAGGNDHSNGSNTFNDDVTITHNSTGRIRLDANAANASVFNADVTFVLTGGGSFQPAYLGNTTFNGNVIVNPNKTITFSAGGGSSTFGGGAAQNIQDLSGGFPPAFDSLVMNKSANELTLNTEVTINDGATFTAGILISSAANLLVFADGAEAYTASSSSHVQGPVRKFGTQAFTFPTGKSGSIYAPITISAPTAAADHFTAEYFDIPDYTYDTTSLDATIDHVSRCEYWILDQGGAATNNVNVTLSWGSQSCGVDNLGDLRVCRWDGGTWRDHGNGSTTGSTTSGTVTTLAPVTSFSPFTLGSTTTSNPLPIELVNFEAVQNNEVVNLYWSTYSETNNALFTVERSSDGMNWEEILFVEGAGNSTSLIEYIELDATPNMGANFYRLKQTDFDGEFDYSPIVKVDFKKENGAVEVYPNPNNGIYFNLNLDRFAGKEVLLVVRDLTGKELFSKVVFSNTGQLITIDLENKLPKGTYLIMASSEDDFVSKRLVVE
jgi:hypothetical protein